MELNMSNAQEYINALRQGDYYQFSKFIEFVNIKYTELLNRQLANDDLTPLIIYEISTTNINKEDIQKINFFYNFLFFRNTNSSKTMSAMTELTTTSIIALVIKDDPRSKKIIQSTKIEDKDEVEQFLEGKFYPFRSLETECLSKSASHLKDICSSIEEQELQEICHKMERQHFFKFIDSVKSVAKD
jgi:hypothetical protein